jgi:hypothetical protein
MGFAISQALHPYTGLQEMAFWRMTQRGLELRGLKNFLRFEDLS